MNAPAAYVPALRFHALTPVYDPVVAATTREGALKRRLLAGLDGPVHRVLDVGCGTGTLLAQVAAAHPEAERVGVDLDPRMLAAARRKLGDRASLVHGDATRLPFEPGRFDRVVCTLVFHHLTRAGKRAALRGVRRCLAPGGSFHLADFAAPQDALMALLVLGPRLLDGFETTRENVRGELPTLIREAGFRAVRETDRLRTPLGTMSVWVAR